MPKKVNSYYDYVKCNRQNRSVPGFSFDVNQFENLIDCWTAFDDIPVILNCSKPKLDKFCYEVYKMDYKSTYRILSGVTDAYMKKTLKNLASGGNSTAISIVTEHFMKLRSEEECKAINIRIVNDLNEPSASEMLVSDDSDDSEEFTPGGSTSDSSEEDGGAHR